MSDLKPSEYCPACKQYHQLEAEVSMRGEDWARCSATNTSWKLEYLREVQEEILSERDSGDVELRGVISRLIYMLQDRGNLSQMQYMLLKGLLEGKKDD